MAQLEALIEWHRHEAQYANLVHEKLDHLRHADDLRRRLIAAQDRTETNT